MEWHNTFQGKIKLKFGMRRVKYYLVGKDLK